jgi:hypothetical protein
MFFIDWSDITILCFPIDRIDLRENVYFHKYGYSLLDWSFG